MRLVDGFTREEEIGALFSEYAQMLVDMDGEFAVSLAHQSFDEELMHLEKKYGGPGCRLYLADIGGAAAGCIALRRLDDTRCEMKRLYVKPEFRGRGLAKALVQKIIGDARELGYNVMLLDTQPILREAIKLYRGIGFTDTERYNDGPMSDTIFMELDL